MNKKKQQQQPTRPSVKMAQKQLFLKCLTPFVFTLSFFQQSTYQQFQFVSVNVLTFILIFLSFSLVTFEQSYREQSSCLLKTCPMHKYIKKSDYLQPIQAYTQNLHSPSPLTMFLKLGIDKVYEAHQIKLYLREK